MPQWYKHMVKAMNKKLRDHQGFKAEGEGGSGKGPGSGGAKPGASTTGDFPLMGQDKRIAAKLDAPKGATKPAAPAKKPASTITMDWIQQAKQKLKS